MSAGGEEQGGRGLSDKDIVGLAQYEHCESGGSLPPYLLSPSSHDSLLSYLHSRSSSPSPSKPVSEYVNALLSLISLSPATPSLSSLLASLLLSYSLLLGAATIPSDSDSLRTLQLFGTLLRYLHLKELKPVVDSILSASDDEHAAQLLDLLPLCFDLLRKRGEADYVDSAVDRLLGCEWRKGMLTRMVSLAKELPFLDKARKAGFLEKVFAALKGVDSQDLPSLVYHLLLLASNGFCKRDVIRGVVAFFGSPTTTAPAPTVLRHIQGTVLLHVNFALKQDPSLGQELLALLKSDLRAFTPFALALLFSVARLSKFADNSLEVLRAALLTAYTDSALSK